MNFNRIREEWVRGRQPGSVIYIGSREARLFVWHAGTWWDANDKGLLEATEGPQGMASGAAELLWPELNQGQWDRVLIGPKRHQLLEWNAVPYPLRHPADNP